MEESTGMRHSHTHDARTQDQAGTRYYFPFNNWLGPRTQLKAQINAQMNDPNAGRCSYQVRV